ncbi:Cytochrome P450 4C1, partial [Araneus ventricosus]
GRTKWRKHRKLLTPTFHFSILKNFIPVFQEQSEILVSKLQLRVQESWIDALPLISSCTLDVICQTAMGISINAQNDENCEYSKAIHEIGVSFMYRALRPWLYPDIIFNLTSHGRKFKTNIQFVHGLSEKHLLVQHLHCEKDEGSKKLRQRMYSVKKGHFHRRNVNQRPQRYLVPGEEYARQEKQLTDVALMVIPFRLLDRFPSAFYVHRTHLVGFLRDSRLIKI